MTRDRADVLKELTAAGSPFELEERVIDGIPWRVFKGGPASFRQVLDSTVQFAGREFLVYEKDRYTYAEHLAAVARLAHRLQVQYGVVKGDRVAIGMRNYPEWVMAFWAIEAIGAVAVPLNAWWTGPELEYALQDSGAKVIVMDGERLARLPDCRRLGLAGAIVARHRGDLPDGMDRWEDVLNSSEAPGLPDVPIEPEDVATIMYTSGTTGPPKGAVATHRNHMTNLMNTLLVGALNAGIAEAPPAATDAPPPSSLQVFPFFHIGGLSGLYINTAIGSKLVTMYKWDTEEALDLIDREQVNATAMVPALLRQLLDHPNLTSRDLTRLGGISSGGAPVPPDLIRKLETEFSGKVAPGNGYGLTETTSAVIINSGAEYFAHPDAIGRAVVGTDIRIVDEAGRDVPDGQIGELWVRGPNVVRGYWNKPADTAESFTDGWFHTGDVGKVEEGLYYVVDRIKDVVIRGGENVYCAEVEAVLFDHPAVADVAVVGVPHDVLGEEVAAVVNLKPGAVAKATDLQQFAAERLARFKVPAHVYFRDTPLPRTATGKVVKRELREELVQLPR